MNKLFRDFSFTFPISTVNLSKKKIATLTALILNNGGQVFNQLKTNTLIIVGSDVQIEQCQKLFNNFNEIRHLFIKSEWISQSLMEQRLISYENYKYFPNVAVVEEPVQQQKFQQQQFIFSADLGKVIPIEADKQGMQQEEEYIQMNETQKERRMTFNQEMLKQYRSLLNYEYDAQLETFHENNDSFDSIIDQEIMIMKKEEELRQQGKIPNFEGDDECMITGTNKLNQQEDIFEGIDIQQTNNVENPMGLGPLRQPQQYNPGLKRRARFWETRKEYFVCEAGDAHASFNNQIIKELDELLKIYTNEKDKGRCIAYRRAISYIKSLKFPIKSEEDVENMPLIGAKIKKKVVEIIQTGKLQKVQNLKGLEKNQVVDELSRVWGIGPTTAMGLYFKGIKSLNDLRTHSYLLNRMQLIGLKYVEELEIRIPREEVTQIFTVVKHAIDELSDIIDVFEAITCGSYRRGKETCGDIDILITRKDGKDATGFLAKLVTKLENSLLTDHLVMPKLGSNGSETYMGVCRLQPDGIPRRIDIKYYPKDQYGCAVLYFTGSDHFNRSMRLYAQKIGYSLSDHGVYPTLRGKGNQKMWKGELIPCTTEQDVFALLGLTYKKPEDRSV